MAGADDDGDAFARRLQIQERLTCEIADTLQAWEQGRFIRFHGAAQWIGWLWPYVAMLYLLARIGARERSADAGPRGEAPQPGS